MRPDLPRIPTHNVDELSPEWITKLVNCVEYAMNHPKGDGKTTYESGGTIHALRQSANAPGGESGDNYEGYFKVIKTSTGYSVINDSDTDGASGYVKAGNLRLPAAKTNFPTADVTTDGAFYIETTYANGAYAIIIKFAETLPDAVNGKDICLIAELKDEKPIQKLFGEHNIVRWV